MNEKVLELLEYNKIREMLVENALTPAGKELAGALVPASEIADVQVRLQETGEALALLLNKGEPPFGKVPEVRHHLKRALLGGALSPEGLRDIALLIKSSQRLKKFVLGISKEASRVQRDKAQVQNSVWQGKGSSSDGIIHRMVLGLPSLDALAEDIGRCINDDAQILDSASEALRAIRRSQVEIHERIRSVLMSLARSSEHQGYLQEPIVTVRAGRYVLPVKQECKWRFPGVIHDQSSSGATVFIEPLQVVELNNQLAQLKREEIHEVERILSKLSRKVAELHDQVMETALTVASLDFSFAKARLALAMNATRPRIKAEGGLKLIQARHPLISENAVPIDIEVGERFDILVLTGPNTGGKTVTLKTAGLLTLMAMAGLFIPASPSSEIRLFRKLFADIGDEQSIEQSLSTFSAHVTNLISILERADSDSLVLIDEIGAGTDPVEGSALAIAILDQFRKLGSKAIVTTHLSELKLYASKTERVENACVEFDPQTFLPTYRVSIGIPGRSSAIEIATHLGMPEEVVVRARELLSGDKVEVDTLLSKLRAEKDSYEKSNRELEEKLRELELLYSQIKAERDKLETAVREAKIQARQLVSSAASQIQGIVKELKAVQPENKSAVDRAAQASRERLKNVERDIDERLALSAAVACDAGEMPSLTVASFRRFEVGPGLGEAVSDQEGRELVLNLGDAVYVKPLDRVCEVASLPDKDGMLVVQSGAIKLRVKLDDVIKLSTREIQRLEKNAKARDDQMVLGAVRQGVKEPQGSSGPSPKRDTVVSSFVADKVREVPTEVSVRGLRVEEALAIIEKYLDDAYLAGLRSVKLIHGKGTGALRRAVIELLESHPNVVSYRLGDPSEGGIGVTIANLE